MPELVRVLFMVQASCLLQAPSANIGVCIDYCDGALLLPIAIPLTNITAWSQGARSNYVVNRAQLSFVREMLVSYYVTKGLGRKLEDEAGRKGRAGSWRTRRTKRSWTSKGSEAGRQAMSHVGLAPGHARRTRYAIWHHVRPGEACMASPGLALPHCPH